MTETQNASPSRRRVRWLAVGALTAAACASAPVAFKTTAPEGQRVEATTEQGIVHGVTEGDVHVFLGVPYGAPVAGADRWLPPRAAAKRSGPFDASDWGPACEQTVEVIPRIMLSEAGEVTLFEQTDIEGFANQPKDPDCLHANIWTPRLPAPGAAPAPAVVATALPPADAGAARSEGGADAGSAAEGNVNDARAEAGGVDAGSIDPGSVDPGSVDPAKTEGGEDGAAESSEALLAQGAAAEAERGLPVIVKLHGGGLGMGSSKHPALDGAILARKGVVVVTLNFRLGPIGFLAADGLFDDELLTGSRGLMDIVLGLEWVRDNIAHFGGDPANVTLMGQSGGGTAVWSVLASPRSEGLVRRAVVMSGPLYDFPLEEQKALATDVLEDWGVSVGDKEALAKVATEDATSTIMLTSALGEAEKYGSMGRMAPNNGAATGTPFMPDSVMDAIAKGRFNGIDLLVGNCDDDWAVSTLAVPLPNFIAIDIWNGFIKGMVADTDEGYDAMVEQYVAAQPEVSSTRAKEVLQTDALYRIRALKAATLHSEMTADPALGKTYAYQFSYKSPAYPESIGAMHGLDLWFAFGNIHKIPMTLGHQDGEIAPAQRALADGMTDMLVSFAATGTPSSDNLPAWPEYEPTERQTMVFDDETQVVSDPQGHLRKLWD